MFGRPRTPGGGGLDDATTELEITGTDDLAFEPGSFTVPAGEEVTVELSSSEAVDHDLVIEGAAEHGMAGDDGHGEHDDEAHAMETGDLHVAHAGPGETITATFMLEEPGAPTSSTARSPATAKAA